LIAFNAVQYSSLMFKSIDGQQWDTMLMTYRRTGVDGEQKPFLIFIDFKSKQISESNKPKVKIFSLSQYEAVMGLVKYLRSDGGKVCNRTPQTQALIDGDFIYIYLTTHPVVSSRITNQENLYISNEDEAKQFFGILFPFYQTARAAMDSAPKRIATKKSRIVDDAPQ